MQNSAWQGQLSGQVRVMQIIIMALAAGCCSFGVIAVVLCLQNGPLANQAAAPAAQEPAVPIITYIALAGIIPMAIAFFVVRGVIGSQARRGAIVIVARSSGSSGGFRSTDQLLESPELVRTLLQFFQTRLIVGGALCEGLAFFCLIAYLLEGSPLALVAAIGLLVVLVLQFPTQSSVAGWIEQQVESSRNQRQFVS